MRGVALPTTENSFCAMIVSLSRLGGGEHRFDFAVVVAAAAEIAGKRAPRLRFCRTGIPHEQRLARHDLPDHGEFFLRHDRLLIAPWRRRAPLRLRGCSCRSGRDCRKARAAPALLSDWNSA